MEQRTEIIIDRDLLDEFRSKHEVQVALIQNSPSELPLPEDPVRKLIRQARQDRPEAEIHLTEQGIEATWLEETDAEKQARRTKHNVAGMQTNAEQLQREARKTKEARLTQERLDREAAAKEAQDRAKADAAAKAQAEAEAGEEARQAILEAQNIREKANALKAAEEKALREAAARVAAAEKATKAEVKDEKPSA